MSEKNGYEEICLYGGRVFDGKSIIPEGGVVFDSRQILRVFEGPPPSRASHKIDVDGDLILPGIVDLHSDALEKCIEMRPGVFFDAAFALQNLDRRVAAAGITSFCHAISFADEALGLRSPQQACRLVDLIKRFDQSPTSLVRHFVHARFELGSSLAASFLKQLMRDSKIDLISFMDHTPGQGQFKTLQSYVNYYSKAYDLDASSIIALAERKKEKQKETLFDLRRLSRIAHEHQIPMLSHDDDTPEKISMLMRFGVGACEFPISLAAARAARDSQIRIFMGAPNLIRDQSTNGHLKASQTIAEGLCDGLVSDYYPECLLQAPFVARRKHDVALAVLFSMITAKPAGFLFGKAAAGCLASGAYPDIVVLNTDDYWVHVHQTWVDGCRVYQGEPHRRRS